MNVNQFQKHVVISVRLHGNLVTKFLKFMGEKILSYMILEMISSRN